MFWPQTEQGNFVDDAPVNAKTRCLKFLVSLQYRILLGNWGSCWLYCWCRAWVTSRRFSGRCPAVTPSTLMREHQRGRPCRGRAIGWLNTQDERIFLIGLFNDCLAKQNKNIWHLYSGKLSLSEILDFIPLIYDDKPQNGLVSLCPWTNCPCDNMPHFVLQNSVSITC